MKIEMRMIGCTLLSAAMAQAMIPMNILANSDLNPTEKTETVYTVLNNDGSVKDVTVSSWLHDDDGIRNISESLDLKNVENVKNDEKPEVKGNVYTWNSDGNDVYYQGTSEKQLPISIQIRYELDGKEMSAKEVANKSGHLKIKFHFENLESKTIAVNGRTVTIHPSFVGGGMLNLDADHYSNVKCDTGKIVNDGTNEMLVFATVPGLSTTLNDMGLSKVANEFNISDDTVIEADVKEFDLGSVMIAMTNELTLEDITTKISTGDLTSGIAQLMDASEQLLDGSKQLHEGTVELNTSAKPLTSSYPQIEVLAGASTQLHQGTSSLLQGITQYTNGVSKLDEGNKKLEQIPEGVNSLYGGSMSLQKGAQRLEAGINQIKSKTDALDESKLAMLEQTMEGSKKQLEAMRSIIQKDQKVLETMKTSLEAVNKVVEDLGAQKEDFVKLIGAYNQQVSVNNDIVKKNNEVIENLQQQIDTANTQLNTSVNHVNSQINQAIQNLETAKGSVDEATKAELDQQIQSLKSSKVDVDAIQGDISNLEQLKSVDGTILLQGLQNIAEKLSGLDVVVNESQNALVELGTDVNEALAGLKQMEEALNKVNSMLPVDAVTMIKELKAGVDQLSAGANSLTNGSLALEHGLDQLSKKSTTAITSLNEGSTALVSNNEALVAGANQLDEGAGMLESQKGSFMQMSEGLQKLQEAFDTLEDGANQLYEGQTQFNEQGMGKLKSTLDLTANELNMLETVFDQISVMNKEYNNFSGAPEGAACKARYVFKTNELKETKE